MTAPTPPRAAATFWGCVLFAIFGLFGEIVFTALFAGFAGSFIGQVSLLMIPVYAFVYLCVGPGLALLERFDLARLGTRIPLTVLFIYVVEGVSGALYRALGLSPWYYDHGWASAWSGGNVTLYYLPVWTAVAFLVVPVWRSVHDTAPAFATAIRRAFAR